MTANGSVRISPGSEGRHPSRLGPGLLLALGIGSLVLAANRQPVLAQGEDAMRAKGQHLFASRHCFYCHRIGHKGGVAGPALDRAPHRLRSESFLRGHFRNPGAVTPGSVMPIVSLTDADTRALAVYLRSLGPGAKIPVLVLPRPMQGTTTPSVVEGKVLYRAVACQSCHMIAGRGIPVGPSLDSYGLSGRKLNGLVLFFRDPDRVVPGSIMPVLHGTDRQLRSLALYMLSLKTRITPTAALGRKIYTQRNCGYCHGRRAEGLPLGPRLAGSRRRNRTDAWLLEHFLAPAIVAGRETMPRVWASDWELQSLLEYLKTLYIQESPRRRGSGA